MAVIAFTEAASGNRLGDRGIVTLTWTGLVNTDSGAPVTHIAQFADRSIQVTGTFGAGGTVLIEGSLDGVTYATLTDQSDNNLSITSAKIETVLQLVKYIRPRVSAGDGTTSLTITLVAKGE